MMKRSFILLVIALSMMAVFSVSPVSAQEPDVDSMTNEELLLLLQSIMQKLEQDETPSSEPTPGPVAVKDPETEPEVRLFRTYDNKKLIVEALPEYMFIQPTEAPKPEKKEKEKPKENSNGSKKEDSHGACPPKTLCSYPDYYCTYDITPDGECVCMCG